MAQIIGLKEKQQVLKDINKQLKSIAVINDFLTSENPTGIYTLSFGDHSTPIFCEDSEYIKALVKASKQDLVTKIRKAAEANMIEFSDDEEALLSLE